MFTLRNYAHIFRFSLRWTARILSVFCIVALAYFIYSTGLDRLFVPSKDTVVMLLFLIGFISGLILAWLDNAQRGGALSIFSVAAFYLLYEPLMGVSSQLFWIFVFALPGLLFVLLGAVSLPRNRKK